MLLQQITTFTSHEDIILQPQSFISNHLSKDFISQNNSRYTAVRGYFTKPTHIAYIGESNEDWATGAMHYVLSQYYLAPNLLYKNVDTCDFVLYNLYNSNKLNVTTNFYLNNGWHVEKDFNNGLILLSK